MASVMAFNFFPARMTLAVELVIVQISRPETALSQTENQRHCQNKMRCFHNFLTRPCRHG
jgi:hypothetical protein